MKKSPQPSLITDETGAIKKPDANRVRVALCYPNTYPVAMGNLGFHEVYHLLNSFDEIVCERAVLGEDGGAPRTIETGRPIGEFEIIAFSLSYETDAINLAAMLRQAGIPPDSEQRARQNSPLIMAGGVLCFLNPEPIAPLCDLIAIGEAEAILPAFVSSFVPLRSAPREIIFRELASLPGVYVPSLYIVDYADDGSLASRRAIDPAAPERIKRARSSSGAGPAHTRAFSDLAEFGDMALVELTRGCKNACRFCAAAYIYRPPRAASAEDFARVLDQVRGERNKVGLVAASITDHPQFDAIRAAIKSRGMTHSVASLRLDHVTAELLEEIKQCGHRTLTFAPECGTEALRRVVNKPITDAEIMAAMEKTGAAKFDRIKLYFQIGLPFETPADVAAIPALVEKMCAALARGAGLKNWNGKIATSINPFVPKPATPFQWHPMASADSLKHALARVRDAMRKFPGVSLAGTSVRESILQAMIARGDRRLLEILRGTKPDRARTGQYVHRERSREEILPWAFIDHGVSEDFLWAEYERARAGKLTPACHPGSCSRCEACG